jgi:peptide/nickel transport system permease protein
MRTRVLATAALTAFGASTIAFGFMHLAPIDPARFAAGFRQGAREDQVFRLREWYGLDSPIPVQYLRWIGRALTGDLGTSVATRREIAPEIARRLPWSLLLMLVTAPAAWALAMVLAVAAARPGPAGRAAAGIIAAGLVIPAFLVATTLVYVFAVRVSLIPILPPFEFNPFDAALWLGLILPSISLIVPLAPLLARELRAGVADLLASGYGTTVRAAGQAEHRVAWSAARVATRRLLAAPLPMVSLFLSMLLVVEEIFNWPGVGRSYMRAVTQRDVPAMQGGLLVLAVVAVGLEVILRLIAASRSAGAVAAVVPRPRGRPSALAAPNGRTRAAAAVVLLVVVGAAAAPLIARFPPDQVTLEEINVAPSLRHPMGTDSSGRDLFSRLLVAGRMSVGMAAAAALVATAAGLAVTAPARGANAVQGALRGAARSLVALPPLGLALAVVAVAGREPWMIVMLFAVTGAAVALGSLRALQERAARWPFVLAARAAGATPLWVGERHLLPHLQRPLAAAALGMIPGFLLLEATLGFLGFTVTPTTPSWGTLLWRAREALHRGDWWLLVFPVAALGAAAWAFGRLADALRDPPPPTYPRPLRLRLGREWGPAPARHLWPGLPPGPAVQTRAAARARPASARPRRLPVSGGGSGPHGEPPRPGASG